MYIYDHVKRHNQNISDVVTAVISGNLALFDNFLVLGDLVLSPFGQPSVLVKTDQRYIEHVVQHQRCLRRLPNTIF